METQTVVRGFLPSAVILRSERDRVALAARRMATGTALASLLRAGRGQGRHSRRSAAAFLPTKNGGRRPPMLLRMTAVFGSTTCGEICLFCRVAARSAAFV